MLVASSPFSVQVSALNSLKASPAPSALTQTATPGSLALELVSGAQDLVTARRSVTATCNDLQVAGGKSSLSADVTVSGSGGLGKLLALGVLDSSSDVSRIPELVLTRLEARLPGAHVRISL